MNISFEYLEKSDFSKYALKLFSILHGNMSIIAPTDCSFEADFESWRNTFGKAFEANAARKIVLIKNENDIVGFFGYVVRGDTFSMEEIQFLPECQGCGIFRSLYGFVIGDLPQNLQYVEAYADKRNSKSIGILGKLGLEIVGTNKNDTCYHFRGNYSDLLDWLDK